MAGPLDAGPIAASSAWAERPGRSLGSAMSRATARTCSRVALGGLLIFAGVGHLTFARRQFQAEVPDWVPMHKDRVVVHSGLVEIALGSALILARPRHRRTLGRVAAAFFVAVFPGNLHQWWKRLDALGLDTDRKRFARLFLQPPLVAWALLSTRRGR